MELTITEVVHAATPEDGYTLEERTNASVRALANVLFVERARKVSDEINSRRPKTAYGSCGWQGKEAGNE